MAIRAVGITLSRLITALHFKCMAKPGDPYEKIVFWSKEDKIFIGMCPELFHGGVHGDDPVAVFKELLEVVDEWVEIIEKDGKNFPPPKRAAILQGLEV